MSEILLAIFCAALIGFVVALVMFLRARRRFMRSLVQFEALMKQMRERRQAEAYQAAAAKGMSISLDAFGQRFDGLTVVSVEHDRIGYLVTMSGSEAVAKLFAELSNAEAHTSGFSIGYTPKQAVTIMQLPEGASDSDPRWQAGYHDGEDNVPPLSADPIYVSGWCHGHNGAHQCSPEQSVAAYQAMR